MIGASPATEIVRRPITEMPAFVGENVKNVAGIIVRLPARMVDVWNAAFGAEERDPNGPMGVVGVGRLAGEVVSMEQAPIAARAQFMFSLAGSLNVALFGVEPCAADAARRRPHRWRDLRGDQARLGEAAP